MEIPKVHLKLMGGFALHRQSGEEVTLSARKGQALLANLALRPEHKERRDVLVRLCWSLSEKQRGRSAFRQCLRKLRAELARGGLELLVAEGGGLALRSGTFVVDAIEAVRALELGDLDRAAALGAFQPADLLAGFDELDPAFEAWLTQFRRAQRSRIRRILERQMREAMDDGISEARAEALLLVEPCHEEAYRFLIDRAARRGDVAAAIRRYARLWGELETD